MSQVGRRSQSVINANFEVIFAERDHKLGEARARRQVARQAAWIAVA